MAIHDPRPPDGYVRCDGCGGEIPPGAPLTITGDSSTASGRTQGGAGFALCEPCVDMTDDSDDAWRRTVDIICPWCGGREMTVCDDDCRALTSAQTSLYADRTRELRRRWVSRQRMRNDGSL